MKIYDNKKENTMKFHVLYENQTFKFQNFYYLKMEQVKYYGENGEPVRFNAMSINPKICLEYFHAEEKVQPVNLVGVIDYEHNS